MRMVKIMMDDDTIKELNGYGGIPQYIGQELLFFDRYGDYQGDWIMVSKKEDNIYLWRGYYGSCSGCDNFEGTFDYEDTATQEKGDNFVYAYSPEYEYNKDDITEDLLYNFIKKQGMSDDYVDLTDDRCREIAKEIIKSLLPTK